MRSDDRGDGFRHIGRHGGQNSSEETSRISKQAMCHCVHNPGTAAEKIKKVFSDS
jgi:hypothetical protein